MASPANTSSTAQPIPTDLDSDYGSDFSPEEAEIVDQLLSNQHFGTEDIEDNPIVIAFEHHEPQRTLRIPRALGREEQSPLFQAARAAEEVAEQIAAAVRGGGGYPDLGRQVREATAGMETTNSKERDQEVNREPRPPDTRSPLERFRTQPKKALSVTDLVSPAWCELQYWYTLTHHGRKRQTVAMKRGSAVHKVLEEQVYTTVKVEIQTREDAFGLRIWNVIQGLRTLRSTGLTRELEIWGTVDGLVVNGVIDELSYICSDTDLEGLSGKPIPQDEPPPEQRTLSEFFKTSDGTPISLADQTKRRMHTKKVYLCDVKTRYVKSLPSAAAFRPTKMQLMLYHRLLSALATNTVDFSVLTVRYNLDATKVFSDSFIAQVGSLNDETYYDAPTSQDSGQSSEPNWSQDSMSTLLAHNTLNALWSLMISEFQLTLSPGIASLGRVLKAEYRSRENGEVVGSKTFLMDEVELGSYVRREMEWWKGEREPQGVVVEEAFKCRSCEFAEGCEWRLRKVDEVVEKVRLGRRRRSGV